MSAGSRPPSGAEGTPTPPAAPSRGALPKRGTPSSSRWPKRSGTGNAGPTDVAILRSQSAPVLNVQPRTPPAGASLGPCLARHLARQESLGGGLGTGVG